MTLNADASEIEKFSALAHRWWDPESEFRPLHEINPLRLDWIDLHSKLAGKTTLDIGCGGGILTESMVARGAKVTGIDLSEKALAVARLHLLESGNTIEYKKISAEEFAADHAESFDVVTCMEMLEHVPDPSSVVHACARLVKPGGHIYLSTLNRNLKSYLLAILGAEYILKMLPRGTHDYKKFITPAELVSITRNAGLVAHEIIGIEYNPFKKTYSTSKNTDVNYLIRLQRPS